MSKMCWQLSVLCFQLRLVSSSCQSQRTSHESAIVVVWILFLWYFGHPKNDCFICSPLRTSSVASQQDRHTHLKRRSCDIFDVMQWWTSVMCAPKEMSLRWSHSMISSQPKRNECQFDFAEINFDWKRLENANSKKTKLFFCFRSH